jgi:hypothetical protein
VRLAHNPVWTLGAYRRLVGSAAPQVLELDARRVNAEEREALVGGQLRSKQQGDIEL